MSDETNLCAVCSLPGVQLCGKCKTALYCSRTCQTQDWPTHKTLCKTLRLARPATPPSTSTSPPPSPPPPAPATPLPSSLPPYPSTTFSKIFILHPSPSPLASKESIASDVEVWNSDEVAGFGSEGEEKKAVAKRFGVPLERVGEAGKGYGKQGSCLWYYYGYAILPPTNTSPSSPSSSSSSAPNPLASALFNKPSFGPVVVVKSGPDGGLWEKDDSMGLGDLVDTVWWYAKEGADHQQIWDQRELQRTLNGQTGRGFSFGGGDVSKFTF